MEKQRELDFENSLVTYLSTGFTHPRQVGIGSGFVSDGISSAGVGGATSQGATNGTQSTGDHLHERVAHDIKLYGKNTIFRQKLWQYEPTIKTTEDLWANFKKIMESINARELKQTPLSETEFGQLKAAITNLKTPYEAGQFLYGTGGVSQVDIIRDDGTPAYLTIFDQSQIGAGDTRYQVVTQIERPAKIAGRPNRRFDTTLLINGLPIIQIEEKAVGHSVEEAFNQMKQYIGEYQYTDIFSTLQILVAMTPNQAKYMANTTYELFNTTFAFPWQRKKDNSVINDWKEFADLVLSIPMAHKMATHYTILDGTRNKQMLKVMRPYQVYATESVLRELRKVDFTIPNQKVGYIWHTTGSGKTITSFKTAWLASRLIPQVEKVVFIVDRVDLVNQTNDQYSAYDPEGTGDNILSTDSTYDLKQKLNSPKQGIIVTSLQKLVKLIQQEHFTVPKKNIVFIVDEAHRSTGGDSFKDVQKAFKHAAFVGYTGTPTFDMVKGKRAKTHELFGPPLHTYTIREAVADHNVLGFKVDFQTTIDEDFLRREHLPSFYANKYPNWTDKDIARKISRLTQADIDELVDSNAYDENEEHIRLVVEDIFKHWRNRSVNGKYNALLTTRVSGTKASTPMALMYFDEFQRQNAIRAEQGLPTLKVGVCFSYQTDNGKNQAESNTGLLRAINHYNHMFGTNFGLDSADEYAEDVATRLNRTASDGQYLDILIVVEKFLTGFDAPQLNTLYVDRIIQQANLVQAYSRTNRLAGQDKPWGRIINYRWPALNEQYMKDALAIYANRDSANYDPNLFGGAGKGPDILAKPFTEQLEEVKVIVDQLADLSDDFTGIPKSEGKQEEMFNLLKKYSRGIDKLKQYDHDEVNGASIGFDYDDPEALTKALGMEPEQEQLLTTSLFNQLKESLATAKEITVEQLEYTLTHVKDVKINYDYLTELVQDLVNMMIEKGVRDGEVTDVIVDSGKAVWKGYGNTLEEAVAAVETKLHQFALELEDRNYAKDVVNTIGAILDGTFPLDKLARDYPVALDSGAKIIEEATEMVNNQQIKDFISTWGLASVTSTAQLARIIYRHSYGNTNDLDRFGELTDLKREGANVYQTAASESVKSLPKMKYRKQMGAALYELADNLVVK